MAVLPRACSPGGGLGFREWALAPEPARRWADRWAFAPAALTSQRQPCARECRLARVLEEWLRSRPPPLLTDRRVARPGEVGSQVSGAAAVGAADTGAGGDGAEAAEPRVRGRHGATGHRRVQVPEPTRAYARTHTRRLGAPPGPRALQGGLTGPRAFGAAGGGRLGPQRALPGVWDLVSLALISGSLSQPLWGAVSCRPAESPQLSGHLEEPGNKALSARGSLLWPVSGFLEAPATLMCLQGNVRGSWAGSQHFIAPQVPGAVIDKGAQYLAAR